MAHPIENILRTTMEQLKQIADVSTVVGAPIMTAGNTIVLPVSKISLGFVSGGAEYPGKNAPVRRWTERTGPMAIRLSAARWWACACSPPLS